MSANRRQNEKTWCSVMKFNFALSRVNSTIHNLFVIIFSCACLPEEIVCVHFTVTYIAFLPLSNFHLRLLFLSSCRCHREVLCFAFDIYFSTYVCILWKESWYFSISSISIWGPLNARITIDTLFKSCFSNELNFSMLYKHEWLKNFH